VGKLAELFLSAAEVSYNGQSHASGLSKQTAVSSIPKNRKARIHPRGL
jgi:hypothetical protein